MGDALLRKPISGFAVCCCARAASGHEVAEPTITLMKSRRRIALPKAGTTPTRTRLQQGFATGEMGFAVSLQSSNPKPPIYALGQKRTLELGRQMSALSQKLTVVTYWMSSSAMASTPAGMVRPRAFAV